MNDIDQINRILRLLIKKIDNNPLITVKDAEQLSVDLAEQHFFVEKKLKVIVDELELLDGILLPENEHLQPHDRTDIEHFRDKLLDLKEATEFGVIACKKLAEDSDKIYFEAREQRLSAKGPAGLFFCTACPE